MTGLIIDGRKYDLDSIAEARLGDLFELKVKTKAHGSGVSLKSINETFDRLAKIAQVEADKDKTREARLAADQHADVSDLEPWDPMELLDDEGYLINLVGLVFLTRRIAGDTITFDDAWKSPFNSVVLAPDDDEDEADEAPAPKDEAAPESDVTGS